MLNKQIFEIETDKLLVKDPLEKWVGIWRVLLFLLLLFFVFCCFCFFALFWSLFFFVFLFFWVFLLTFVFVVAVVFVCLFFSVDFYFQPQFSDIFMKRDCKIFLKRFSSFQHFFYLHYFAVFEFNVIKNCMLLKKKKKLHQKKEVTQKLFQICLTLWKNNTMQHSASNCMKPLLIICSKQLK